MEAALKALKVPELKHILHAASVSLSGKQNKADLISKILASPQAIDTYNAKYKPNVAAAAPETPQPAPAESVTTVDDRSQTEETLPEPAPVKNTPTPAVSTPTPAPSTTTPTNATAQPTPASTERTLEEIELEKRKARAARFGIPLVEPKPAPVKGAAKAKLAGGPTSDDPEKIAARAARFGRAPPLATATTTKTAPTKVNGRTNKRAAPVIEEIDAEEAERRRKRAERFGTAPTKVAAS